LRSSLDHLRHEGVLAKGTALLLKSNQAEGFDCPGCAWPAPNAHSTFEFCENGVKAVAAEATNKRVTREFFAAHSVSALAQQSDYFLGLFSGICGCRLGPGTHQEPVKVGAHGIVEGLNNKAKLTIRKSYGLRSPEILEMALYHALGKLPEPKLTHEFY